MNMIEIILFNYIKKIYNMNYESIRVKMSNTIPLGNVSGIAPPKEVAPLWLPSMAHIENVMVPSLGSARGHAQITSLTK